MLRRQPDAQRRTSQSRPRERRGDPVDDLLRAGQQDAARGDAEAGHQPGQQASRASGGGHTQERSRLHRVAPSRTGATRQPRAFSASGAKRRSRRLLVTTNTELNAIAAPAIIGLSSPAAASGMAATL